MWELNAGQSLVSYSVSEQTPAGEVPYSQGVMGRRTPGTFAICGGGSRYEIEIYYSPISGQTKTFLLDYVLANAVVAHEDVADLQWTWGGKENDVSVDNLRATGKIPPGVTSPEELRVWCHGRLSGRVEKVCDSEAQWEAKGIRPRRLEDGRVAFPSSLLPGVSSLPGNELDRILAEEKLPQARPTELGCWLG